MQMDRISNEGFMARAASYSDEDNRFPVEKVADDLGLSSEQVNHFAEELTELGWIERPKGPEWQLIGVAAEEAAGRRQDVAAAADPALNDTEIRPIMDVVNSVIRLFNQGRLMIVVGTFTGHSLAGEVLNAGEKIKEQWKPDPMDVRDAITGRFRRFQPGRMDNASMAEAMYALEHLAREALKAELIARKIADDFVETAKDALIIVERTPPK
jgi:hypothetical protein